ncbi:MULTISPECIES: hypothetical protein [unclassified Thioalkalivibrio]|uniref:hypothetical protein n=1 Tax=unclassified Thioalkalivibrio TaxID=2621013 RepID=UPI00036F2290|nr:MULTISPECIES: hypothetical protein [unclassified Thioalkalivibrio]
MSDDDECYYLREYASGESYSYSDTNQLIFNLKKGPEKRGTAEWKYKRRAIQKAGRMLRESMPKKWLQDGTFVPVPPSKNPSDPDYDDRMWWVLESVGDIDRRKLVVQDRSFAPAHLRGPAQRPTVDELVSAYRIDHDQADPPPTRIAVVDDVLTAGTHFKAMQHVLQEHFPQARIVGLFISRRIWPEDDEPF